MPNFAGMKKRYFLFVIAATIVLFISIHWKSEPTKLMVQKQPEPCFLLLSDVHLNSFAKTCNYGDDTGMDLWNNLKSKLKSIFDGKNPPKFIIYTGDLPAHYKCDQNCYLPPNARAEHNANLVKILEDLRKLVAEHHIPLFYVPGNNDALAGDYYSFTDSSYQTIFDLINEKEMPYPALNVASSGNKPPYLEWKGSHTVSFYDHDNKPTQKIIETGYYSAEIMPKLRIIVLNSVILGKNYFNVDGMTQRDEGNEEISWLKSELMEAKILKEKVYIAMHIPPGTDAYAFDHQSTQPYMWAHLPSETNTWLDQFLRLTSTYQSTISGIFYGHTHMDELRRIYDSTGTKITAVAISCPGITPQHYNNSGFKLVYYDSSNFQPVDFETFYSTPTAASWGNLSYRFSDIFHETKGMTLFDCVKNQPLPNLNIEMDSIYTVMNGPSGYNTSPGIEVKPGE